MVQKATGAFVSNGVNTNMTFSSEYGYRLIWRLPNGSLQPARGQARIPSFSDMNKLIEKAAKDGWIGRVDK